MGFQKPAFKQHCPRSLKSLPHSFLH